MLSEPESRTAYGLILRLRPRVTIWFHQPLGLVDESGGSLAIERSYAEDVGLPLRRLPRYHGSAASWQNARLPGSTAFVVELPGGPLYRHRSGPPARRRACAGGRRLKPHARALDRTGQRHGQTAVTIREWGSEGREDRPARIDYEVDDIVRVLRDYGALTRDDLRAALGRTGVVG